jgi:hypothetical protein
MVVSRIAENLIGVAVLPLALEHLVNGRNNEEGSIGYKRAFNCSELTFTALSLPCLKREL